jgi:hypothetical protein
MGAMFSQRDSNRLGAGLTLSGILTMLAVSASLLQDTVGWGSGSTFRDIVGTYRNLPMLSAAVFLVALFFAGFCAAVIGILLLIGVPIRTSCEKACLFVLHDASVSTNRYTVLAISGVVFMILSVSMAGRSSGIGALFWSIAAALVAFVLVFALAFGQQQINVAHDKEKNQAVQDMQHAGEAQINAATKAKTLAESQRDDCQKQLNTLQAKYTADRQSQQERINQLNDSNNSLSKERDKANDLAAQKSAALEAANVRERELTKNQEPLKTELRNEKIEKATYEDTVVRLGPEGIAFKKALVDTWISEFKNLAGERIVGNEGLERWTKRLDQTQGRAMESMTKVCGLNTIGTLLIGKKGKGYSPPITDHPGHFNDQHNQQLSTIDDIIKHLEQDRDSLGKPKQ